MSHTERAIKAFKAAAKLGKVGKLCGRQIGFGAYRTAYEMVGFPKFVIKRNQRPEDNANADEVTVWNRLKKTSIRDKIVPILAYAHDFEYGAEPFLYKFILMPRVKEIPPCRQWVVLPHILLCDTKKDNLGVYKGRTVVIDYATSVHRLSTRIDPGDLRRYREGVL